MTSEVIHGDSLDVLRQMDDNSIDAIVTDPPYGLSFMGKRWDYDVPSVELWAECLRVLKPGGHLLAFAGTRTQHRMAVRIEDAGFEIRDMIMWVYGSGFPKSLDVSKAIDKAAGAQREVVGEKTVTRDLARNGRTGDEAISPVPVVGTMIPITAPATDAARQWQGWGTALKPALEPITVARKPLSSTVAANVLQWGTGALNIDACRVDTPKNWPASKRMTPGQMSGGCGDLGGYVSTTEHDGLGRWPANLIHDGSDEVVGLFPQTAPSPSKPVKQGGGQGYKPGADYGAAREGYGVGYDDASGSAARYFYCAKASRRERDAGLENSRNNHPTVKPVALIEYLIKLVTPPGGVVLDPFAGSGTTGVAARRLGFSYILVEIDQDYVNIAKRRIEHAMEGK